MTGGIWSSVTSRTIACTVGPEPMDCPFSVSPLRRRTEILGIMMDALSLASMAGDGLQGRTA